MKQHLDTLGAIEITTDAAEYQDDGENDSDSGLEDLCGDLNA